MEGKFKSKDGSVNLLDIFFYFLSYWYWFVISLAVCVGFALYKYESIPNTYSSSATIIIKDPSNTKTSTRLVESYSAMINRTTPSNELLQFRSKRLMTDVVNRLGINVSYIMRQRLRDVEMYKDSPVLVDFSGVPSESFATFSLIPHNADSVVFKLDKTDSRVVAFGDTLNFRSGTIRFSPN